MLLNELQKQNATITAQKEQIHGQEQQIRSLEERAGKSRSSTERNQRDRLVPLRQSVKQSGMIPIGKGNLTRGGAVHHEPNRYFAASSPARCASFFTTRATSIPDNRPG